MPTITDDDTFCQTCNDSGEYEIPQLLDAVLPQYLPCPRCPRCDICDMRAVEGTHPGKIGDDWACCPEHAAEIIAGGAPHYICDVKDLLEGANSLEQLDRARRNGGDFSPRDFMLLARACALMNAAIIRDAHRFTDPPRTDLPKLNQVLGQIMGGE